MYNGVMWVGAVKAEECYGLRSTVLRPGQPKANWTFETDRDPKALHMAVQREDVVIAVASLLPESHPTCSGYPWRLRGMAVDATCRGQGIGNLLLQALQSHVKQHGGGIWCTARLNVEGFYIRNGFEREGDVFVMNNMSHIRMLYPE